MQSLISEILILKIEMLLVFQNKTNYWVLMKEIRICRRFVGYIFVKYRFVRSKIYTFRFLRYRCPQ